MKGFKICFVALFILLMYGFFLGYILKEDSTFSYTENRNLTIFPEVSLNKILEGSFMSEFEKYVTDQVMGRDMFVSVNTQLKLLMGQNEINNVILGEDGYLIEKVTNADIDMDIIERNTNYIKEFLSNHSNAYVGIIPTASDILKDKYTEYPDRLNQKELIDKIYSELSSENTIDIYNNLLGYEDVYYKTDHHWTTFGAYLGYEQICKKLGKDVVPLSEYEEVVVTEEFKGTIHSKINYDYSKDSIIKYEPLFNVHYERILNMDNRVVFDSLYDESKLLTKEMYAYFLGGNNGTTYIHSDYEGAKGKLLVIKDSYSHCLTPFLANNYEEILLVDFRYFNAGLSYLLEMEDYDDILILYNLNNFATESKFSLLNK